jgi:hypothetical protein
MAIEKDEEESGEFWKITAFVAQYIKDAARTSPTQAEYLWARFVDEFAFQFPGEDIIAMDELSWSGPELGILVESRGNAENFNDPYAYRAYFQYQSSLDEAEWWQWELYYVVDRIQ